MFKILLLSFVVPFGCLALHVCEESDLKQVQDLLKRAEKCLETEDFDTLIDEIIHPDQVEQLLKERPREKIIAESKQSKQAFLDLVRTCQKLKPTFKDKFETRRAIYELPKPVDGHSHFECELVEGKWYISLG